MTSSAAGKRPDESLDLRAPGRDRALGVGLTILLLSALVLLAPRDPQRRVDPKARLRHLMTDGPGAGIWEYESLDGLRTLVVAPHPKEPTCLLWGHANDDSAKGHRVQTSSRRGVARLLVPGRVDLFFRNYRLHAVGSETDGQGRSLVRAMWVPRYDYGGETSRWLWVDPEKDAIVRFEDRSYDDGLIRSLRRESPSPGRLDIPPSALKERPGCRVSEASSALSVEDLARKTPFAVFRPLVLPAGFELVGANYTEKDLPGTAGEGEASEIQHVQVAYLDYSDGFAFISLGMATAEDMDALERAQAARGRENEDPDVCPPIPEPIAPLRAGDIVIRRRRDRCRTVLRIDGLDGVSVALLGRNELPEDAYLEVIENLAPVRLSEGAGK